MRPSASSVPGPRSSAATSATSPSHAATARRRSLDRFGRHRLPRQQCRHRRAGARRPARPHARELRPGDGRQPARHAVPHAGRPARGCWRSRRRGPRSIVTPLLGQRRAGLARARRLLHLQGRRWRWRPRRWRCGWRREGIAVFEVRPGIIRTDMTAAVAAQLRRPASPTAWSRAPLGRAGGYRRGRGCARAGGLRLRHRHASINVDGGLLASPRL